MNTQRIPLKHKNLWLPPEVHAKLMALSKRKNVSANSLMNQAIDQFLKQARQRRLLEET